MSAAAETSYHFGNWRQSAAFVGDFIDNGKQKTLQQTKIDTDPVRHV